MFSVVKKTFITFIVLFFILSAAVAVTLYMSIQKAPIVNVQNAISPQTAQKAKSLSKKLLHAAKTGNQGAALVIEKEELQGLADMARRAFDGFRAQVGLTHSGALAAVSLPIPYEMVDGYFNATLLLLPSDRGLHLGQVTLGDLTFSGETVLMVAEWATNQMLQGDTGTQLINSVRRVRVAPEKLEVAFKLPQDFNLKQENGESLGIIRDKLLGIGYRDLVAEYYQLLLDYKPSTVPSSLAEYLSLVYSHARERTLTQDVEVVRENQAAILALASYFGSYRLRMVLGSQEMAKGNRQNFTSRATLANRVDLQQHFIYSAAIEVLSNQGISDLIGELKELVDTMDGGSGFSFADLVADKAGVRFAKLATMNDLSALTVQKYLAEVSSEAEVFPSITNLPEGISASDFEAYYENVESQQYHQMIADIDSRLAKIPLYQD